MNITVLMYSRVVNLQFLVLSLHLESKSALKTDGFLQPEHVTGFSKFIGCFVGHIKILLFSLPLLGVSGIR